MLYSHWFGLLLWYIYIYLFFNLCALFPTPPRGRRLRDLLHRSQLLPSSQPHQQSREPSEVRGGSAQEEAAALLTAMHSPRAA